jgi:tetratricopeptide (TPR) repeat protein
MRRGGKFLVSTTVLAVAACGGSEQANLKIRSIPTPLAQGAKPVPFRIAEARGQLALGNVALALEAFRIAARDNPNSTDALAGIAICYDRMGRYDLSRRNYEAALAIAPADVELLGAFAQSLRFQGEFAEAARVRDEIALRLAASKAAEVPALAQRAPAAEPAPQIAAAEPEAPRVASSVPVALATPAPLVATQAAPPEVAIPRLALAEQPLSLAEARAPARAEVTLPNMPVARSVQEAPAVAPR